MIAGNDAKRLAHQGAMFLCLGARGDFFRNCVASFRATNPHIALSLIADRPYSIPFQWVDSRLGFMSRRIKTQLYKYSPFNVTLYVGNDTVCTKPLNLDEMLGDADFAVALDGSPQMQKQGTFLIGKLRHASQAEVNETIAICGQEVSLYDTAVMVWRDNSATRRFFDCWQLEWDKYGQRIQLAFARALSISSIRLKVLDRKYNSNAFDNNPTGDAYIERIIGNYATACQHRLWKPSDPCPFELAFQKAVGNGLMSKHQYRYIGREIYSNHPSSLLVFGAGFDSEFWVHCSAGNVAFVEDNDKFQSLCSQGLVVNKYRSRVNKWVNVPAPPRQISRMWDFVIVDGPNGYHRRCPGRQISIAWAAQLAKKAIFVHDYERVWERQVCDKYLGAPYEVIDGSRQRHGKLAVFLKGKSSAGGMV
jgi:hypothetical protein